MGSSTNQPAGWQWKVGKAEDNPRLRMLYEPGNWGDIFKGAWAVEVAQVASRLIPTGSLRYLDPFAGAPIYPLTPAAEKRIAELGETELARNVAPFASRNEWPSTALLIRSTVQAQERGITLQVYDQDNQRRSAWSGQPDTQIIEDQPSGEAILSATDRDACDLVLVDPYDLLAAWKSVLDPMLHLSERCGVLCYIYNRAPRSVGHLNLYKRFRKALDEGRKKRPFLLGRLACDERLPRAYHEMLLLGPGEWVDALREPLRILTRALARRVTEAGAFEES